MSGKLSHHEYYLQLAKNAHLTIPDDIIAQVKKSSDEHLNDVATLQTWTMLGNGTKEICTGTKADGTQGDWISSTPAANVCAAKALARHLADQSTQHG